MKGKLTLFIVVFLLAAYFASGQEFYASGRASVDVCACSTAASSFIVRNTGSTASIFNVHQTGDSTEYLVSAPRTFILLPGEEQVVASVFSAPCGSAEVYQLNSLISTGVSEKRLSQKFVVSQCSNVTKTPEKKESAAGNSVFVAVWSTTAGKALILLPLMIIIIVLVVALAKRFADNMREKKAWAQPQKLVLKQPKRYFWEKMFPAEEELVEISAPRKINWKLIITILAIVILIALLAYGTYYAAKSGIFTKQAPGNITKNITKPVTVTKNITQQANTTKTSWAMNLSKFRNATGSLANKISSTISKPLVKYSLIGVIAAAILIALIIVFRKFIWAHWKPVLPIVFGIIVIAAIWYLVYRFWYQLIGVLSPMKSFIISYWLYVVSGIVVLGVIIAVILAVRSEDEDTEQIVEAKPVSRVSKKKKSPKRKK